MRPVMTIRLRPSLRDAIQRAAAGRIEFIDRRWRPHTPA